MAEDEPDRPDSDEALIRRILREDEAALGLLEGVGARLQAPEEYSLSAGGGLREAAQGVVS